MIGGVIISWIKIIHKASNFDNVLLYILMMFFSALCFLISIIFVISLSFLPHFQSLSLQKKISIHTTHTALCRFCKSN